MHDGSQCYVITKEGVSDLQRRLLEPGEAADCRDELRRILEIKDTLLWRADKACACVGQSVGGHLAWEVQVLERALEALSKGNSAEAALLLGEYIANWSSTFDE